MFSAKYPGYPGLKTGTLKPTVKLTLKRSPETYRQSSQDLVVMPSKHAHLTNAELLIKHAHLAARPAHLAESPEHPIKPAHLAADESPIKPAHLGPTD